MRQLSPREKALSYAGIARGLAGFSRRPFAPRKEIEAYQLERLQTLIDFAYREVPFYGEKYRKAGVQPRDLRTLEDLRHFPTVEKREVLDAYPEGALARGLDLDRCLVSKSSGSTGQILSVVHRADRLAVQGLALHRLISMMGFYAPWHRFTYVYTSEYPSRGVLGSYPMEWLHTLAPVGELASRLLETRPRFLACYPSHLRSIARELGPLRALSLGLRGISVSSELSTPQEREELGRFFGCRVHDEYSTEELTRLAAQCREGRHHLFEDVVLTEIVGDDGQTPLPFGARGEVTGTYLHNFAMPFIRYRQGDLATVTNIPCPCGRTLRSLENLAGRRLDSFVLPSGRELTSGFLLDATYSFLFDVGADLAAFRLVQEAPSRVRIELVKGPRFDPSMATAVAARFRELCGEPMDVRVEIRRRIDPTQAGKHHPIVSLVPRSLGSDDPSSARNPTPP